MLFKPGEKTKGTFFSKLLPHTLEFDKKILSQTKGFVKAKAPNKPLFF